VHPRFSRPVLPMSARSIVRACVGKLMSCRSVGNFWWRAGTWISLRSYKVSTARRSSLTVLLAELNPVTLTRLWSFVIMLRQQRSTAMLALQSSSAIDRFASCAPRALARGRCVRSAGGGDGARRDLGPCVNLPKTKP
jgi:hypothetical protein